MGIPYSDREAGYRGKYGGGPKAPNPCVMRIGRHRYANHHVGADGRCIDCGKRPRRAAQEPRS